MHSLLLRATTACLNLDPSRGFPAPEEQDREVQEGVAMIAELGLALLELEVNGSVARKSLQLVHSQRVSIRDR